MSDIEIIKGGKLFLANDELCFSIGSREINQSELQKISDFENINKVLFYCIKFQSVDFSIFKKNRVKQFTFLHGNISAIYLEQICRIPSVKTIQILDADICNNDLGLMKKTYPDIKFK